MIRILDYGTLPVLDVRRGVALGSAMVSAVQADAPEPVKSSARAVLSATASLQLDWAKREGVATKDRRPADNRNDRAWSALEGTLSNSMTLAETARGKAAIRVHLKLFKNGLSFTTLAYEKQWAEGDRRLKLIDEEGLTPDIVTACGGPEFLDEIRASHEEYGDVLNITQPAARQSQVNLTDTLTRLRNALNVHVSQLVAWGNQSAANEPLALSALKPIDDGKALDAARASGAKVKEPEVTPETPLPEAP